MNFKNVTVIGGGIMGSQIAFQTALNGFKVTVFVRSEKSLETTENYFKSYVDIYQEEANATKEQVEAALNNLTCCMDLSDSVKEADLVIEAIAEVPEIKIEFYKELAKVAPKHTVFVTNSSTLPPSMFAEATGRPEMFTTLHFCVEVWKHNVAEIMMHPGTDRKYFDMMIEFAKAIGMVPIPLEKEQPGYVLNTLLVPNLLAALELDYNGIAPVEAIDKTWMIATGADFGPFGFIDLIGLNTSYAISKMLGDNGHPLGHGIAEHLKVNYIDKGKAGKAVGEGYYKYPNPAYESKDFLK